MIRRRRGTKRERGATLIVFALLLVFLLTVVAFAVDLGQGRLQRRSNQQIADLATLAAGQFLAGFGGTGSSPVQTSPFDACVAAVHSVQVNADQFRPTLSQSEIESACSVFYDPYSAIGTPCDSSSPTPTETSPIVRGPYTLTIRYPIPAGELQEDRFQGGVGADDGDDACKRMRVTLERDDDTAFAGVIGIDSIHSSASAVVRGTIEPGGEAVPAFLILERYKCGALGNSVGGASEGIVVEADGDQAGYIHVDSDATGAVPTYCSNSTTNAGGVTTYASPLPSGDPSLTVESAGDSLGVLSIVATGSRAAYGGGFNVTPTEGADVISRSPVDEVFEDSAGDNSALVPLHAASYSDVSSTANLGLDSPSWVELGCDLAPSAADLADATAKLVRQLQQR